MPANCPIHENNKHKINGEFSRKNATDILHIVIAMAEDDLGAAVVMGNLARHPEGNEAIRWLDNHHCYGSSIWNMYYWLCDQDIDKTIDYIMNKLECQICNPSLKGRPHS